MKKNIAVAACLLLGAAFLGWSDDTSVAPVNMADLTANIVPYVQLDILASRNAFLTESGIAEMRNYSLSIAPFYRDALFQKFGHDPWIPAVMNVLTGGIGSFMMGDPVVGAILQGGMAAVYGVLIMSIANLIPRDVGYAAAEIGGVVITAAGAVWPFIFASDWNGKLARALGK